MKPSYLYMRQENIANNQYGPVVEEIPMPTSRLKTAVYKHISAIQVEMQETATTAAVTQQHQTVRQQSLTAVYHSYNLSTHLLIGMRITAVRELLTTVLQL